ncbi:MAG: sugar ABC transporter permease [Clostridia bacterium]|nr:sugar ABC transporter permease [Clostridia bacterium]
MRGDFARGELPARKTKETKKFVPLKTRKSITGVLFALPGLLGFIVLVAIPFGMTVYYSTTNGVGQFVFLDNYIDLFHSTTFQLALVNTMRFTLIGVSMLLILSLALSVMFYHHIKKSTFGIHAIKSAVLLPIVIPTASIVLIIQILFEPYGIINGLITTLNGSPVEWLYTAPYSFWILIVLFLWKNCGYCMVILLAALDTIEPSIHEAALCDRANGFQRFFYITLPLISTSVFFVAIIGIIGIYRMFRESYLLMGDYPHESVYMLQNFINNNIRNLNYQRLSSASIVFLLFVTLFVVLLLKNNIGKGEE